MELQLYLNSYCHLCEDMKRDLKPYRDRYVFDIKIVDIEGDTALEARFGEKIPVLMAGDQELCHYHLDRHAIEAYFSATKSEV